MKHLNLIQAFNKVAIIIFLLSLLLTLLMISTLTDFYIKTLYNKVLVPPGVIVKAEEGLGNQLFRYACSYALSKKFKVPLYIFQFDQDHTYYAGSEKALQDPLSRKFILDRFNIQIENGIDSKTWYSSSDLFLFDDKDLLFDKISTDIAKDKLLMHTDYCESERFFKDYKEDIKKMFVPKIELNKPIVQKWKGIIGKANTKDFVSVAIHIRRGDYLIKEREYWLTPMSYYRTAMKIMLNKFQVGKKKVKFFVFSDDIDYVKMHLINNEIDSDGNGNENVFFVSSSKDATTLRGRDVNDTEYEMRMTNLEEFFLMTLCGNMIVANSTFSWWAGYLIQNKDKIIIGPKFHEKFFDHYSTEEKKRFKRLVFQYWYPPEWIVIDPYENI